MTRAAWSGGSSRPSPIASRGPDPMRRSPILRALALTLALGVSSVALAQAAAPATATPTPSKRNPDESKVGTYVLPPLLQLMDGRVVSDAQTWTRERRPQILDLFAANQFGRTPTTTV